MEKIVKDYIKPNIKVNDFISRHHLLWEIGEGSTEEQLGHDPEPTGPLDPGMGAKRNNVWEDGQD
jgi:hypothetical protein